MLLIPPRQAGVHGEIHGPTGEDLFAQHVKVDGAAPMGERHRWGDPTLQAQTACTMPNSGRSRLDRDLDGAGIGGGLQNGGVRAGAQSGNREQDENNNVWNQIIP